MSPPVLRAPNGVMQDGAEFHGAGKPYYDPAQITVPTLLVLGEWDRGKESLGAVPRCAGIPG